MHSHLKLEASPEDTVLIEAIVERASKEMSGRFSHPLNRFRLTVDLTVCHTNGSPLRLAELLDAPYEKFAGGLLDISANLNRQTGLLDSSQFGAAASLRLIP